MFCTKCGKEIDDNAVICTGCGCQVKNSNSGDKKNWVAAFLLCWFLGGFGIHRFYTGYITIGIIQLLTLGGCGIWTVADFISLAFNKFKDNENKELEGYIKGLGIAGFTLLMLGVIVYFLILLISMFAAIGAATMSN